MEVLLIIFAVGVLIWGTLTLHRQGQVDDKPSTPPATPTKRVHTVAESTKQKPSRPIHITSGVEHKPPPEVPPSRRLHGKAYVIDGDTIVVEKIKVRLAGIDAPELDQPWGQKSKWEMVKICIGQSIRVELTGETSYDRLVGTCYLPDGRDIGAEIIKVGLALDGGHFSKGKYRHLEPSGIRKKLRHYGRWR